MRSPILMAWAAAAAAGIAAIGVLDGAGEARAQTTTDTFEVRARVTKTCTVVANDLDFGVYNSSQAARNSTNLSVQCTPLTPFTVQVGGGSSNNRGDRTMTGPATLRYALYRDGGYTDQTPTTGNDFSGASDPQGTAVTFRLYGQIAASQSVPAGNYIDTVTVTISY
jgi:spore coat protein U-like protein